VNFGQAISSLPGRMVFWTFVLLAERVVRFEIKADDYLSRGQYSVLAKGDLFS